MKTKAGIFLIFLTAIVSGFSIFINKFGVKGLNPSVFTFAKNVLVAIVLFCLILAIYKWKALIKLRPKHWLQLVSIGFVGGSVPFLLFFNGLSLTSSANAAFIHKTMFIFVAILSASFLKERIKPIYFIGTISLLVGNWLFLKVSSVPFGQGELMILAATIFWAVENTISKYTLKELEGTVVAFGRMFFGSCFIFIWLLMTGEIASLGTFSGQAWLWVVVADVFLLLYLLTWYNGLKYVPVSIATSVLLLGSLITTTLNVIFSGTTITLLQAFGMILVILGIITIVSSMRWQFADPRPQRI